MFHRAIVRRPGANFGNGLSSANLGLPDYARVLKQHDAYCLALESCGLVLTRLEADSRYPDSTFVEDTAVLVEQGHEGSGDPTEVAITRRAIITRPGAISRSGEVTSMKDVLGRLFSELYSIGEPGTVDGGDICQAENHFFIGISERTNEAGAEQLASLVHSFGFTSSFVDIRTAMKKEPIHSGFASPAILHLKSGLAYLGDQRLVAIDGLVERAEFGGYDLIRVNTGEEYAANCVRINDYVLVAAGYPALERKLRKLGQKIIALDMTEFQKMDGGLSCLSLRF